MTQNERLWTIIALVAVAIVFAITALVFVAVREPRPHDGEGFVAPVEWLP